MLEVEIFLDGADAIIENRDNPLISGFTTNPSLMKKAGVVSYEAFARQVLLKIPNKPISFEVLSDDLLEMYRQAKYIASWGNNVNVKIPVTNTHDVSTIHTIQALIHDGITVNVTAITLISQVVPLLPILKHAENGYISVFAGRIADTGVDPVPLMSKIVYLMKDECPQIKLIWASAREIFNVIQADRCGCDIITIGSDLLKKYPIIGKDLHQMSLDTVKMFSEDAKNYSL